MGASARDASPRAILSASPLLQLALALALALHPHRAVGQPLGISAGPGEPVKSAKISELFVFDAMGRKAADEEFINERTN